MRATAGNVTRHVNNTTTRRLPSRSLPHAVCAPCLRHACQQHWSRRRSPDASLTLAARRLTRPALDSSHIASASRVDPMAIELCNRRLTPVGRTRRADPQLRTPRSHAFRQVSLWGPFGCCKSATIVTPCLRKCDSTDDCRADTRYTTWPLCEAHRLRFTGYQPRCPLRFLLRLRHRCRQPACSAASMLPGKAEPPRPIARLPRGWARRNGAGEG